MEREDLYFLDSFREETQEILQSVSTVMVGQRELKESILIAMLTRGHLLIRGMPGLGKTMLVQSFARVLGLLSGRIQFTPDLLPSDIVGTEIPVDITTGRFDFRAGPIFGIDMLLADELNRTTPKTQSALLEGMQERSVTVAGVTRSLSEIFFCIGTINPIEIGGAGTYPLPEAQIDRFLLEANVEYPTHEEERKITAGAVDFEERMKNIVSVSSREKISKAQRLIRKYFAREEDHPAIDYIVRVVRETRISDRTRVIPSFDFNVVANEVEEISSKIEAGASTRACIDAYRASMGLAFLRQSDLSPEIVQEVMPRVLRHRLILSEDRGIAADGPDAVVADLLKKVSIM